MKDLTKGNIYKTFILFAIPLVLAGILSKGYNLVDTVIAGKFLGDGGLAAIGATAAFLEVISSMIWGYGIGFSIYIARLFGAGNFKEIKNAVYNQFLLLFVISMIIFAAIVIFKNPIMDLLKVDEAIRKDAGIYMIIYTLGFFFMYFGYDSVFILNAFGISGFPFAMSIVSTVLNIGGNIVAVAVLKSGVAGIAWASLITALIVDIFYVIKLKQCFGEMGVTEEKIHIGLETVKESFSYATTVMLQQGIMYIAGMVNSVLVNGIGSAATAGYVVVLKIYEINAGIYQNSAKTVSNYTAQSIGAGKKDNLKKGVRVGFVQGVVLLTPVFLVCMIFARPICKLFFPAGYDGEGLQYALLFFKVYFPFIYANLINNLFHSFFRGTASMKLLLIATSVGAVSRIAFCLILAPKFGMDGVFSALVISWVAEVIFAISAYISGAWKKTI